MEINRTVNTLKTTLSHIEKTLGCNLKHICGRSQETLQQIENIVSDSRLQSFFQGKNENELRKLHLLLFLNTDIRITSELESDDSVGHVVGAIPQLSSRLYFAMGDRFKLFKYMYEIVEFGPGLMVPEVLDIVRDEVKYLSDGNRFAVLAFVLEAATVRLMKTDCEFGLKEIIDYFRMLILQYNKIQNDDDDDSSRISEEQMIIEGYKFLSLITLLHRMTKITYAQVSSRESPSLYNIKLSFNATQSYAQTDLKPRSHIIRECYECVFYKFRELMMDLDLSMYLTWYEVQMRETNLQRVIGEEAFYLRNLLMEKLCNNQLPAGTTELIEMLQNIAKEPAVVDKTLCDTNAADYEKLIRKNEIFDDAFLQLIERFLENSSFESDTSITLVRKLFDENTRPNIDLERVKSIITSVVQKLESQEIQKLLEEVLAEYGPDHLMVKEEITDDFVRFINQVTALYLKNDSGNEEVEEEYVEQKERELLEEVTRTGFYAPPSVLKTIITEGCSERNEIFVIMKILRTLKPLCLYKCKSESGRQSHSMLVEVLKEFLNSDYKNLTTTRKEHFNRLVIMLNSYRLMNGDDFLSVCLLPLLYVNEEPSWSFLSNLLSLFKDFFPHVGYQSSLCFPILVIQIAQLLEDSRWSVATFSTERLLVCERAIDVADILMQSPDEKIAVNVRYWIEHQLNTYSFITRAHFMRICRPLGTVPIDYQLATFICEAPESYEEFISRYSKDENTYVVKMGQLILRCTPREFQHIIQNYAQGDCHRTSFILDWISDSITFISNPVWYYSLENTESTETVYACLGQLVNNFLGVLQKNGKAAGEVNYVKYINRIIAVVKLFPNQLIGPYQFNIVKFLVEELPKLKETSHDFDNDARQLLVGLYLL